MTAKEIGAARGCIHIISISKWYGDSRRTWLLLLGVTAMLVSGSARATEPRKVFSPIVEEGEVELEHVGTVDLDRKASLDKGQAYTFSAGYGVTSFWFTEFEGEFKSDPGANLAHEATAWENTFQVTPQGEYWFDLGVFAEYEIAAKKADADALIFGPIVQKEWGDWLGTLNLFIEKQLGANASEGSSLRYGGQLRYRFRPWLQPAIEAYGEPGEFADLKPSSEQAHQLGPVLIGKLPMGGLPGKLKYEVGYLFGLTSGSPQGSIKWRLEYEFHF